MSNVLDIMKKQRAVCVVRTDKIEDARTIIETCVEGGMDLIEVTYTQSFATELIEEYASKSVCGAGSVLDAQTAYEAIKAGAKFIVSPCFGQEVLDVCNQYAIPYIPGFLTINEAVNALKAGCNVVKLFPASTMGPGFIKSVTAPVPQLSIMPTGGVNINNAHEYLDAGAICIGAGSEFNKFLGDNEAMKDLVSKYVELAKSYE